MHTMSLQTISIICSSIVHRGQSFIVRLSAGEHAVGKTMKYLVAILVLLAFVLPACAGAGSDNDNGSPNSNQPTSTPIDVRLDYFGVRWNHQDPTDPVPWKVQLYLVVDDGETTTPFRYPSDDEGMNMESFHIEDLGGQRVFYTSSVGDHLKISVLACSSEDKETKLAIWKALETWDSAAGTIRQIYESLPLQTERVGYWEQYWSSTEKWGTEPGRYDGVGNDDLQVWLRIWSDNEPDPASEPTLLPDVKLLDVDMDQEVKCSGMYCPGSLLSYDYYYSRTLHIMNNEKFAITVEWKGHSSVTGDFDTGSIQVSAGATAPVSQNDLQYRELGPAEITYKLLYNGHELPSSWSGTVNVVSPCT